MKKLKKIIKIIWRGTVLTFREIFTGLMLGISALLILIKLAPTGQINVGTLVLFGLLAGLMKGISKFILMELLNKIPAEDYTKNYPKYKMMLLWSAVFVLSALVNYGFRLDLWLMEPARYIYESNLIQGISQEILGVGLVTIFLLGILSYFYEPRYD